jgi:hypothetical protein
LEDTPTSDPARGQPTKRGRARRLWQVATGLSILLVALAVFAWQQNGDGGSNGPLNAVAEAAERTQREPGGRIGIRTLVSPPDRSESFTVTGKGVFDAETGRNRMVMTFPNPTSGRTIEMEVVGDATVIYMRSSMFGSLPGGREWMALDISLGQGLDMPVSANGDVRGELELLEAATGEVRKLGKANVRGVPTTRYRGRLGVAEQAKRLREKGADKLASLVERDGVPVRFEAWIDAKGLVRRMRVLSSQPQEGSERSTNMDMRMDFFDFGPVSAIDVPRASEVFDATALAEEELGLDPPN